MKRDDGFDGFGPVKPEERRVRLVPGRERDEWTETPERDGQITSAMFVGEPVVLHGSEPVLPSGLSEESAGIASEIARALTEAENHRAEHGRVWAAVEMSLEDYESALERIENERIGNPLVAIYDIERTKPLALDVRPTIAVNESGFAKGLEYAVACLQTLEERDRKRMRSRIKESLDRFLDGDDDQEDDGAFASVEGDSMKTKPFEIRAALRFNFNLWTIGPFWDIGKRRGDVWLCILPTLQLHIWWKRNREDAR